MLNNGSDKISVIVPAYNIEKYIGRCLESILAQIYGNLEVIVVDDGSKDNTAKVVKEIAEKDNRVNLISKANEGVTVARLTGVNAATGDWIGFVDGDDYIDPEMYDVLLTNAKKYRADISHCGYKMVFPSRTDYYYNTGNLVEQDKASGVADLLQGSFIEPSLCNKLYRKSIVDKALETDKMDLSIKNTEDLLINYFFFKYAEKSVYLDKCFYHYILRKGSAATSAINENKLKDPLRVLKLIKADCADSYRLREIVNVRISATLISISSMQAKANPQMIKPFRKQARIELRALKPEILKGNYSIKVKLFVCWCAFWPWSYGAFHRLYSKLRGIDKKYEVK